MSTVTMIDTIGASAGNIPVSTPKVAGYVTGSGDVPWSAADWARFPDSVHIRIDQSPDANAVAAGGADAYDLESGACTVAELVAVVHSRVQAKISQPATIYGTSSSLQQMISALQASQATYGAEWYFGKCWCWLANWNLDEAEAAALVGTNVEGFTCVAVQWASPTSNPDTIVPGGTATLAASNLDLSVANAAWNPAASSAPPVPGSRTAQPYAGVTLSWAPVAGAREYAWQIWTNPDNVGEPVKGGITAQTRIGVQPLSVGTYYWKVGVNGSVWSPWQTFTIS